MSAREEQRNPPAPVRPALFWGQLVTVPLLAAGLLAALLAANGPALLAAAPALPTGAVVALAAAVALVLGGELRPIVGSRTVDPGGVTWSTTFGFAVLLFAGVVPAALLYAAAAAASGILARKAVYRWLFSAGQYALSLSAAAGVLHLFGRDASLAEPWAPTSVPDVAVVLVAAAAYFVVNEILVTGVVCALTGRSVREEVEDGLLFELATNGAQLALAPIVAVIMQEAPPLTVLGVLPVAAVHRSAAAQRESEHAAAHDHLTGLPNRRRFVALTEEAIAESQRTCEPVAVFVVDLDRFKEVNDVLGHPAGDQVLTEVARRLRSGVREQDVVARLGGDEFAVLVPALGSAAECTALAERLRTSLDETLEVDGRLLDLGASIGVAVVPDHADDFELLFSRADVAMYAAKRDGTGVRIYSPDLDAGAASRLGMLGALRRAVDGGELFVEYQPKVSMDGQRMLGVEALVRWRTERGAVIPPDHFIPLAEQSGLMSRVTGAVLDQALAQCAAWARAGLPVPVAVNVSLRDVLDPSFAVGLAARLVRLGVVAPMVTLEITERLLADDVPRLRATLEQLREIGVTLSLDDFGTGWSSLVLLRHLPVSEVKLDRSFVRAVATSPSDAAIVRGVTDLAHELGLVVVAEGVEDAETWAALSALGCDGAQGWHVAHPMSGGAVTDWLVTQPAAVARGPAARAVPEPLLHADG